MLRQAQTFYSHISVWKFNHQDFIHENAERKTSTYPHKSYQSQFRKYGRSIGQHLGMGGEVDEVSRYPYLEKIKVDE